MNEKCEYDFCAQNKDGICEEVTCTGNVKVHKPEPNESPSSPRTRGSLPASQADSAFEGTGSQLAPVLCPPDPLLSDKPGGVVIKCVSCGAMLPSFDAISTHECR